MLENAEGLAARVLPIIVKNNSNTQNVSEQPLCSGFGKYHTNKETSSKRKPYNTVRPREIGKMVQKPVSVEKDNAPWIILSNTLSRAAVDLRSSLFYGAWLDIDDANGKTIEEIKEFLFKIIPYASVCFSSRSATQENHKTRYILFYEKPVSAEIFLIINKELNRTVKDGLDIIADNKNTVLNQIAYLPNKGEFYKGFHNKGKEYLEDPEIFFADAIARGRAELDAQREAAMQRRRASDEKVRAMVAQGQKSVIDAVNEIYDTESLLIDLYGATPVGDRLLSPYSQSGSPGMVVKGKKFYSDHGSDREAGLGRTGTDGRQFGKAFDILCHCLFNNDQNAAIKYYGDNIINLETGKPLSAINSLNWHKEKNTSGASQELSRAVVVPSEAPASPTLTPEQIAEAELEKKRQEVLARLSESSLLGKVEEMKRFKKEACFVIENMAIMNQMTAIYAPSNAGKTLITMKGIIDSVKAGRIKGSDVHYINADDPDTDYIDKAEIFEDYGINMHVPNFGGCSVESIIQTIGDMIELDIARDKIFVLDTYTKFVDHNSVKESRQLINLLASFTAKGGTVLILAHCNKNRNAAGELVAEGTAVVTNNSHCCYLLDTQIPKDTFDNSTLGECLDFQDISDYNFTLAKVIKKRSFVGKDKTAFAFLTSKAIEGIGGTYRDLLESVREVDALSDKIDKSIQASFVVDKNLPIVGQIKECLKQNPEGITQKDVFEYLKNSGIKIGKDRFGNVINDLCGDDDSHLWFKKKGDKNSFLLFLKDGGF